MSDDWDSEDRQTIEPEVNSWKEFWKAQRDWCSRYTRVGGKPSKQTISDIVCGKLDACNSIQIDLQKHFLGEVARIKKEIRIGANSESLNNNFVLIKLAKLEGQLLVYKKLAGVEEINE